MHSPGVEVRPLRQITGQAEFNETFFTDVRVPVENVVGEINDGWRVAMTTLLHERGTLGFALATQAQMALASVVDTAKRVQRNGRPAIEDPLVRQKLAQAHVEISAMRLNNYRALTSVMKTGVPGPEGSLGKLLWSESAKRLYEAVLEFEGPAGLIERGSRYAVDDGRWQYMHLRSRGNSIEAGTSEILRNIIAERVLGLPKHK
jgi:alkylation response protein AidB-like acyl-CoA dehydrogenase